MRYRVGLVSTLLFVAAGLQGQQPAPQPTPIPEPPIVVYKIDLAPTGTAYAMNKPTQEGGFWVFRSLPDRTVSRIPTANVKNITQWSNDLNKEVVWQVDLDPSGSVLTREEPVKKGAVYVLRSFKGGTLISLHETDILKITRLTGLDAFKAKELKRGLVPLTGGLPSGGSGGTMYELGGAPTSPGSAAPPAGTTGPPNNWFYEGVPGASDAYGPASGTVGRPGGTPMMPEPTRRPN